jgi:hypothetical protein
MSITPAQCRAARGVLADGAMITREVIVDFEKERRVPTRNNLAAIQRVLRKPASSLPMVTRPVCG